VFNRASPSVWCRRDGIDRCGAWWCSGARTGRDCSAGSRCGAADTAEGQTIDDNGMVGGARSAGFGGAVLLASLRAIG
jgi:hypothetical protein